MYFYVNYIEDNTYSIVERTHFKNRSPHSPEEVDFAKKYQICWPGDDEINDINKVFYDARIIYVADTRKSLQDKIKSSGRIKKMPPRLLVTATDDSSDGSEKEHKRKSKEDKKKKDMQSLQNMKQILQKKKIMDEDMGEKNKPTTSRKIAEIEIPPSKYTAKNKVDKQVEYDDDDDSINGNRDGNTDTNSEKLDKILEKLNELDIMMKEFKTNGMNASAQTLPPPPIEKKVGDINNGQMYVGQHEGVDITIHERDYQNLRQLSTKSTQLFVKNAASLIIGNAELSKKTVTGTKPNAQQNVQAKEKLDPGKVLAVRDLFYYYLTNEKKSVEFIEKEMKMVNTYLARKCNDLRYSSVAKKKRAEKKQLLKTTPDATQRPDVESDADEQID